MAAVVLQDTEGAAIDTVHHHHVGILGQQFEHRRSGVHAGGTGYRADAFFQRCDTAFVGMPSRVADTAVGILGVVVQAAFDVGTGGIDGRENRVVGDAMLLAGVDGAGGEITRLVGHDPVH
ncbi:hypothetical protein D3C80_1693040 [compost metagenome]